MELIEIPLKKLKANPGNPRDLGGALAGKDPAIAELAESIKQVGILQPLLVHPIDGGGYQVIDGDRRRLAAELAGFDSVPGYYIQDLPETLEVEAAIIANLQREDLAPLEEAAGIQALLDRGWDTKSIAADLGKKPEWILRRAQLVNLTKSWRKAIEKGNHWAYGWPASWCEPIARYPAEIQEELLRGHLLEYIRSLAHLERALGGIMLELRKAPWKLDDATLDAAAGACLECAKRSDRSPGLFDAIDATEEQLRKNARCLDQACWQHKAALCVERKAVELEQEHGNVVKVCSRYGAKGAVSRHDMKGCKKSEKGAVICLHVDGEKAGKTYWAVPQDWARKATAKASGGKGSVMPLKERRAKLEKRRAAWVNEQLLKSIEKFSPEQLDDEIGDEVLLRALSAFGTLENKSSFYGNQDTWDHMSGPYDSKKTRVGLWDCLLGVFAARLGSARTWIDGYGKFKDMLVEHEHLCRFVDIDLATLRLEAEEKLPEPKSWASLNKDGSPKKAKLAGKKKGKAKASAKKKPAKKSEPSLESEGCKPTGMKPAKKTRTRYSAEEKAELVAKYRELTERALTIDGASITEAAKKAAKEVGVPTATLERWATAATP